MPNSVAEEVSRPALTRAGAEIRMTMRLMADNFVAGIPPGVLFTAAACAYHGTDAGQTVRYLATSVLLSVLYLYVFDTSNQARSAPEDALNKPYRPIPAGLATSRGLRNRFWVAMALYAGVGWVTGTLPWVLLWQAICIVLCLVVPPRHHLKIKQVTMSLGIIAQLAAAWQLVGPLDRTAWTWILVLDLAMSLVMRLEDIRDVEGDRRVGRRTVPMIIGHWPVRIWFAVVYAGVPVALHLILFAPARPAAPTLLACDLVMATICWTAALRTLVLRNQRADRISYQLYCASYCAALACGIAVL